MLWEALGSAYLEEGRRTARDGHRHHDVAGLAAAERTQLHDLTPALSGHRQITGDGAAELRAALCVRVCVPRAGLCGRGDSRLDAAIDKWSI